MPTDEQPTTPEQQPTTPAGAQNPDTPPADEMIPKSRFDEINKRMKAAEALLAKQQKDAETATTAELAKKQEYEKLYQQEAAKVASLEAQFQKAQAEMRRERIKALVEAEARKANFAEPADAHLFLNLDEIEDDEKGKPKGVDALVKELAKAKSYLLTTRQTTPGNGARPTPAGVKVKSEGVTSPVDIRSIF